MVKLKVTAAEQIPLIEVVFLELTATKPAPLVVTLRARHMITALIRYLCYPCRALLAVYYIALSLGPLKIFNVVCLLARDTLMLWKTTFETNYCVACVTSKR
jgi:hypothetical protein